MDRGRYRYIDRVRERERERERVSRSARQSVLGLRKKTLDLQEPPEITICGTALHRRCSKLWDPVYRWHLS